MLYICMFLYFPLLLSAATVFTGDFRPQALGSPLFRALFLLWLVDGWACMILSIMVLRRLFLGVFPAPTAWLLGVICLVSLAMGILPAYILVELAIKLIDYLRV